MALLSLVLAHLIGDFFLQTEKMVKNKKLYLKRHLLHQFVVGFIALFIIFVISGEDSFLVYVAIPSILFVFFHWIIDIGKINGQSLLEKKYGQRSGWELALFVIDQLFHFVTIVVISVIFFNIDVYNLSNQFLISIGLIEGITPSFSPGQKVVFVVIMLIIATSVSGHLIRIFLGSFTNYLSLFEGKYTLKDKRNGQYDSSKGNYQNTNIVEEYTYMVLKDQDLSRGKIIGYLERLLVIVLVMNDSISSIAFIIAAKSITRFKQLDDRDWAEYFLLGTLASIFLAIVYGIIIKFIV
ncbi:DUF3307 domain-containing protein [Evansella cellulosilytica]|uniref:DUF3307 domain-containing protein n=1 Tax=Evansella cellulosilytica (strain ATCC 21833 / DSM 2522 / FERM P-1141 / JCM 9156 / N-4) TaxID=649639 RepID=E6TQA6_EVAC2|nr:DUF3307 domain-containing protein [Evansella cellulosilytica]ADU29284.1 hypothetical protein Bcell_1011 [Evansella cellulosilytica DSM 2522]